MAFPLTTIGLAIAVISLSIRLLRMQKRIDKLEAEVHLIKFPLD